MANVTISIPAGKAARVTAALEAKFGRLPAETDIQLCQRAIRALVTPIVYAYELEVARNAAAASVGGPVDPEAFFT